MNMADALRDESRTTYTENGALAYNTTGEALLDLYSVIGALRTSAVAGQAINEDNKLRLYEKIDLAYKEDKLALAKLIFHARDIREGLGEREVFILAVKYIAEKYPELLQKNIELIAEYGRYDDYYALVDTQFEYQMWGILHKRFEEDLQLMKQGKPISLLSKWLKSVNTSSKESRKLGLKTAKEFGLSPAEYRKKCAALRKYLKVTETYMTTGKWDKINYSQVPSRAMMIYRDAFLRHDGNGFQEYLDSLKKGEVKVNARGLYPYDIVERYLHRHEKDELLEEQWKALPNYVKGEHNAIVVADVSGSMRGRPMATAIGLAIYFAERTKGAYHNLFLTFSSDPEIVELKDSWDLQNKINMVYSSDWGLNTNLYKSLRRILDVAIKNKVPKEEMVEALFIVTDMEIDSADKDIHFCDRARKDFEAAGYNLPKIIFWNVQSRHDTYLAKSSDENIQLISGQSVTSFGNALRCLGYNPVEAMYEVLNSERYQAVQI